MKGDIKMTSQQIQTLIDDLKLQPNNEWRNKIISHLKDAYAASIVMEHNDSTFDLKRDTSHENGQKRPIVRGMSNAICECKAGVMSKNCSLHGWD